MTRLGTTQDGALRLWGGEERPGRIRPITSTSCPKAERRPHAEPELRHGRLAELRPLRLRRRRLGTPGVSGARPTRRNDRGRVPRLLRTAGTSRRADRVRRSVRLRAVHRPNGIPSGGIFTGAEGIKTAEQAAPTAARPDGLRPVLPPGVRHLPEQRESDSARSDVGRESGRDSPTFAMTTSSTSGMAARPSSAEQSVGEFMDFAASCREKPWGGTPCPSPHRSSPESAWVGPNPARRRRGPSRPRRGPGRSQPAGRPAASAPLRW